MTIAAELHALADRVRRLAPSHRDPEAFHVEKGEIAAELLELAEIQARRLAPVRGNPHRRRPGLQSCS
jgi:hypothetical protein